MVELVETGMVDLSFEWLFEAEWLIWVRMVEVTSSGGFVFEWLM
jgi:hypothetical protein